MLKTVYAFKTLIFSSRAWEDVCRKGQPSFGFSDWFFASTLWGLAPVVWTLLLVFVSIHLLAAMAFYKIWVNRNQKRCKVALYICLLHFFVGFMFVQSFSAFRHIEKLIPYPRILLLASLLAIMALTVKVKRVFLLLLPYLMWVSFLVAIPRKF